MPIRKLTMSRKGSAQELRESTPASPAKGRSRPPESSSAASNRSPRPGNTPSALNASASSTEYGDDNRNGDRAGDETPTRRRSIGGKRRISSLFQRRSASKGVAAQSRSASEEPEPSLPPSAPPVPAIPALVVSGTGSTPPSASGNGATPHVHSAPDATDGHDGRSGNQTNGAHTNGTATGSANGSGNGTAERGLPPVPTRDTDPNLTAAVARLESAVARLEVNAQGQAAAVKSPSAISEHSGFPFGVTSPGLQVPSGGATPTSPNSNNGLTTPQRQAKMDSLYSQWADDSESDDEYDWATPEEGLSEVEEGDEDADAVPVKEKKSNGLRITRNKTHSNARVTTAASDWQHGDPRAVDQAAALAPDLDICRTVLGLFLSSKMKEAENLLVKNDPQHNHLYLQQGHGLIQTLKGMMTFDALDLLSALEVTKATQATAILLRRPPDSVLSRLGGFVRSGAATQRLWAMTPLERHAELIYAETMLIKAVCSIVAGGDWLGLIKEAFNMRSAHGIYRSMQQFLDEADKNGFDEDIDMDFRSGVLLGTGTSSLMLSLLPARVLRIAEVFGYAGDRTVALTTLMSAGGWSYGSAMPAYDESNEGIRRPICDIILLVFHLCISVLMPVSGVDIPTARNVLAYNMRRYPDGIFFLYFQARLHSTESEPELANESLQKALELDLEYVQLQHMCLWDYGCNYLQMCNWDGARQCFDILREESNWSRAVYQYATAVTIMELTDDPEYPDADTKTVVDLVVHIPKLIKKIAGKSLPVEKFVARKARKFVGQNNRLFLPAMELAYVFSSLSYAPRRVLLGKWLPHIDAELAKLEASTPEDWGIGIEYWDDYALGHFLRGMVQFLARYQPEHVTRKDDYSAPGMPTDAQLDAGAEADFLKVVEASPNVRLDHYLLYHNHYELGRLYAKRGDVANARANFEVVINSKLPRPNLHGSKNAGKYSLEGALQIKTHAAMQDLKDGGAGHAPKSPSSINGSTKSGKNGRRK